MKNCTFFSKLILLVAFICLNISFIQAQTPTLFSSVGEIYVPQGSTLPVIIDEGVAIVGTGSLNNATVYISGGFQPTEDELIYPNDLHGVTGSYNSTTGVLLLSGTATVAQYQEILATIQYRNTKGYITSPEREFWFCLGNAIPFKPSSADVTHFYQYYESANIEWVDAKTNAEALGFFGLKGYLTTIIHTEENDMVFTNIKKVGWIGASDEETNDVWKWVTGPETGQQFSTAATALSGKFANWQEFQPDNAFSKERYAQFMVDGKWNDYGNIADILPEWPPIEGYYVEYGDMSGDPVIKVDGKRHLTFVNYPLPSGQTATKTICQPSTVADIASSSIRWYDVATGGTELTANTQLQNNKTYYAETYFGTVVNPKRTPLIVYDNQVTTPTLSAISSATNKAKLCPGDKVVWTNYTTAVSYQWKKDGEAISAAAEYSVPANGAGQYTIMASNTICSATSSVLNVEVHTVPVPVIYEKKQAGITSILIVDNTHNLYSTYYWSYASGVPIAASANVPTDRQFIPLDPLNMSASYMVNITTTDGCVINSALKTVTLMGLDTKLYPTVNNGSFTLSALGTQTGNGTISVYSSTGLLMKRSTFVKDVDNISLEINHSDLPAGTYIVHISLGNFNETHRIMVK